MSLGDGRVKWPMLLGFAVAAGAAIAAVDNFALDGEVSPIVVLALLFAATAAVGAIGGARRSAAALAVWAWVPLVHVGKRVLDLPDTLHPNTSVSILMLAAFSLAVATVGAGCGVLARRLAAGSITGAPESADPGALDQRD